MAMDLYNKVICGLLKVTAPARTMRTDRVLTQAVESVISYRNPQQIVRMMITVTKMATRQTVPTSTNKKSPSRYSKYLNSTKQPQRETSTLTSTIQSKAVSHIAKASLKTITW